MNFAAKIIKWYHQNKRDLPWRNTRDAYIIWVSEIILQQTRVEQGLDYFNRFLEYFPNIKKLALAKEVEILKLWQGLGYYTRARNLHRTAQIIMKIYNGQFPIDYDEIVRLPGIGPYTASAITSFSFNYVSPVIDGNVIRVITRYFGIKIAVDTAKGKKQIAEKALELIDKRQPGIYNQAIMELGALICKPLQAKCNICPLKNKCIAYKIKEVETIPVKLRLVKIRQRYFNYLLFQLQNQGEIFILIKKRTANDVWKNLFDFPLIESEKFLNYKEVISNSGFNEIVQGNSFHLEETSENILHKLTHQHINTRFLQFKLEIEISKIPDHLILTEIKNYHQYPMSRLMENFLSNKLKKIKEINLGSNHW